MTSTINSVISPLFRGQQPDAIKLISVVSPLKQTTSKVTKIKNPNEFNNKRLVNLINNTPVVYDDRCRHLHIEKYTCQTRSGDEKETEYSICKNCKTSLRQ